MRSRGSSGRPLILSRLSSALNSHSISMHRWLSCRTWRTHVNDSSWISVQLRYPASWFKRTNDGSTSLKSHSIACRCWYRTKTCASTSRKTMLLRVTQSEATNLSLEKTRSISRSSCPVNRHTSRKKTNMGLILSCLLSSSMARSSIWIRLTHPCKLRSPSPSSSFNSSRSS